MKYECIEIINYKGIEKIKIDLSKSPIQRVFTLVGLNESGKTTILEAINSLGYGSEDLEPVTQTSNSCDYHSLIPMHKRDNFNGKVIIKVTVSADADDHKSIKEFAKSEFGLKLVSNINSIVISQVISYSNSKFDNKANLWTNAQITGTKEGSKKLLTISHLKDKESWYKLVKHLQTLLPRILYFRNFLFDFPDKIYLDPVVIDKDKHEFYCTVIQDILDSLGSDANIKSHILERAKSSTTDDKKNLQSILLKMSRQVTKVVFGAWSQIFERELDKEINILCDKDEANNVYLEFNVVDSDGNYLVSDRSLGFRWFFVFFLLTYFRRYRKGASTNDLFLFDEPASNLHPSAQSQLLVSLEKLIENSVVIYTTHSHHLINPKWLEGAYVVINTGLNYDSEIEEYSAKKTLIQIESYRKFATDHPDQSSYFQPILDVLDYCPSRLELIPKVVLVEGKNDFYTYLYLFKTLGFGSDINILPCNGADNLSYFISLYLGWNRDFIIVLDSDKKGRARKSQYIKDFGLILENRVFTLEDIDSSLSDHDLEHVFSDEERLQMQQTCYPESTKFIKSQFNRSIQELFINNKEFVFSKQSSGLFTIIHSFMKSKL